MGQDGVTAPRPIYSPTPEFSEKAKQQPRGHGTVKLTATVSAKGKVIDVKVTDPLGMGLDEKAIETVRQWRFKPGTKDGKPVAVEIAVQVDFHLY